MDKPCITCGIKDASRGRRARHCSKCVGSLKCVMCQKPHERKAGTKYCLECLPKIPTTVYHPKESRRVNSPKQDWSGESYLGLTPTSHDWARLAAYLDGEGCIRLGMRGQGGKHKAAGYTPCFYAYSVVTNTDPRLPAWCSATFGMRVYGKSQRWAGSLAANWKGCFFAQASGFRACWILQNCMPWFILKRAQAEIVLEHQKTTIADGFGRTPGSRLPQDILEYRRSLKEKISTLNKRGPREILAKEA